MQSHIITILIIISTIPKFDKVARDYLLINVTFRAPPDAENQFCISAFGEIFFCLDSQEMVNLEATIQQQR